MKQHQALSIQLPANYQIDLPVLIAIGNCSIAWSLNPILMLIRRFGMAYEADKEYVFSRVPGYSRGFGIDSTKHNG